MKNLKKVLAFVTMITMLLSVAVSAGTLYPDVDDNASYVEAVETLNALGIMIGDDKGNFNPEASITRAETAAIVTRMKALGEAASAAGGTKFSDVPADHWAAGYVNLAEQSNIINGYGDGTFGPSDPVTFEQVIKMIVAALGYTPEANTKGGYPSGYMIIASREEITKGVSVVAGAEAPRAAVARLVFNALDVPVMEQVSFKVGEEDYAAQDGTRYPLKTLLKNALKVDKYEGVVSDTYLTAGTDVDDDFIKIALDSKNGVKVTTATTETFVEGKTNAAPLFGNWVVAYAKEDAESGDLTLVGITRKSGKNTELAIDYTQITDWTAPTAEEAGKLSYYETAASTLDTDLDIAAGAKFYYNGKSNDAATEVEDFMDTVVAGEEIAIGSLTLIDNNNDDVYDIIMLMSATDIYVVAGVDANAKRLEDKVGATIPLDVEDDSTFIKFFKADGSVAEFADIKEGDVLTVYESADGRVITVYLSDAKAEGTVGEIIPAANGDNSFKIGNEAYRIAYADNFVEPSVAVGDDGIFYLNHEGRIVAKDAVAAAGNYAYLLNAAVTSDINGATVEMKFVNTDGTVETAALASKVTPVVDGTNGTAIAPASITDEFAPLFEIDGEDVTLGTAGQRLFQLSKNSAGKINKLFVINANSGRNDDAVFSKDTTVDTEVTYNADQKKLGRLYFNDETLVLSVAMDNDVVAGAIDEKDVRLTKVSAFFADDVTYSDCVFEGYDIEGDIPAIVIAYNANAGILESTKGLLVTKVSTVTNANGNTTQKIYGLQNGVEVSAELSEDYADDTLVAGDFIIFAVDEDGAIDKAEILMSAADAAAVIAAGETEIAPANVGIEESESGYSRYIFGFAQKRKSGGQLVIGTNWFEGAAAVADEDGSDLALRLNANGASFYEVNLLRTPNSYAAASFGDIDTESRPSTASTTRISNWVFVREYDGVVMDVVIYTAENPTAAPVAPAPPAEGGGSSL